MSISLGDIIWKTWYNVLRGSKGLCVKNSNVVYCFPHKMTDKNTTIQALKLKVQKFVKERNWTKYHKPRNLAVPIAVEAAELLEHF